MRVLSVATLALIGGCGIDVQGSLIVDAGGGAADSAAEPVDAGATQDAAGPDPNEPVVAYTFLEAAGAGTADVSSALPALPLDVADVPAGGFGWKPEGLELSGAVVASPVATKVYDACTTSGAVTVEAWVTPAVAAQGGPARVFTYSNGDVNRRNFTIGVGAVGSGGAASRYLIRFGTSANVNFELASAVGVVKTMRQHVVGTFAAGTIRLWVDGTELATDMGGGTLRWSAGDVLAIGGEPGRTDRSFQGVFSYAAVFCRELSASEIAARFARGPPR